MFKIRWEGHTLPEYDPEKHNPEKVFALLCYRGIHYAKWVHLNIVFYKYYNNDRNYREATQDE